MVSKSGCGQIMRGVAISKGVWSEYEGALSE